MANFCPKCDFSTNSLTLDSEVPFVSKLFIPPVYSELLIDDTEKCRFYRSSDCVVLDTQRLSNLLGADTARSVIDDMRQSLSMPSNSEADHLSDEQILQFVRSRHIQSPAELRSWIESFDDKASKIKEYFTYLKSFSKSDTKSDTKSDSVSKE